MERAEHRPVMLAEVLYWLRPKSGGRYVDLTLGLGGHAEAVLEQSSPEGQLLGIDRDPQALRIASDRLRRFGGRVRLEHGCFADLPRHLKAIGWGEVDGLLADLGASSLQLDNPARGFSFLQGGPLDMRMDQSDGTTLAELLRQTDAARLAATLSRLGQVKSARTVARRILQALAAGELDGTAALARLGSEPGRAGRLHPATRVFLALRLWVNQELEQLAKLLAILPEPLAPGGRALFLSFHSLEDRLVKQRLHLLEGACRCPPDFPECRCGARAQMRLVVRRALRPKAAEVEANPRARSARLRVAERLAA